MRNGERHQSCRCHHAQIGRVIEILNHVFYCRKLPDGITVREKTLIVGKLVWQIPHGNGFGCQSYCLSERGRQILVELGSSEKPKLKEVMV